nr:hypothetical protein [Candidatus Mycoplasma haematolamae]
MALTATGATAGGGYGAYVLASSPLVTSVGHNSDSSGAQERSGPNPTASVKQESPRVEYKCRLPLPFASLVAECPKADGARSAPVVSELKNEFVFPKNYYTWGLS